MSSIAFYDGKVPTEGDELYYKVRGEGKPILFIAPAGGNGDGYYPVACVLAGEYKAITYDRRANTRSTKNFPNDFDIRQQSRDAMHALPVEGLDGPEHVQAKEQNPHHGDGAHGSVRMECNGQRKHSGAANRKNDIEPRLPGKQVLLEREALIAGLLEVPA
jgi:hypothetical protein